MKLEFNFINEFVSHFLQFWMVELNEASRFMFVYMLSFWVTFNWVLNKLVS